MTGDRENTERLQGALALFREVCDLSDEDLAARLDEAGAEDPLLRSEVQAMLAWDATDDEGEASQGVRAALSTLAREAESASLPKAIGPYRIVRLIAHGGMGVVYEAEQENPARRVALKVARTGGTTTERARRFALEAQLLARLQHPGIAQIIEAGTMSPEDGGQPYFVMELVEGQSLTEYAKAHLRTTREKLDLMIRVCEAVAYAHGEGVIHRDLKPDNVLIDTHGTPKILDFGVAKVEDAGGFGATTLRTEAGRVIGTLGYMAPEQLGGRTEGLDASADVYSLGVMIYELLSGRLPHDLDAATLSRALAVVTTTDAPLLGVIRPEYRGDIEAVVAKALEKDHRHRYPGAAALRADIERHLRGEPTLARPSGPLQRAAKWTRRNPGLATAALGLFLAISTVAGVLLVKNSEVQSALTDYERLRDARLYEEAIARADELWPTRPEQTDALQEWCATYGPIVDRIEEHRAALERIRTRGGTLEAGTWTFEDALLQWKHDQLTKLVEDLEVFAAEGGALSQVKDRFELARAIEERTVDSLSEEWKQVNARIRKNAKYGLSGVEPQVGFIPLGPDPDSGLEEFLHFETHEGDVPRRDEDGKLPITDQTGLVFVLIPGGSFLMGAEADPKRPEDDYSGPWPDEGPVHEVALAAFCLSKYEMTRGQWSRGHGPVSAVPRRSRGDTLTLPAMWLSWRESSAALMRLDLLFPTEAQWEYAARAGGAGRWPVGDDPKELQGHVNLLGAEAKRRAPRRHLVWDAWLDDGYARVAPIGTYSANAWGLHDMIGNVAEWCRDAYLRYDAVEPRPGDGLRSAEDARQRVFRGGSFHMHSDWARSAMRFRDGPENKVFFVGLRPAAICTMVE